MMQKLVFAIVAVLAATVLAAVPALARQDGAVSRKVKATDLKFTLPLKSAHRGRVTFLVVNNGHVPHDFKIAGKKTPLIQPGHSASLKVTFKKKGRYPYLCTVPGHAAAGMKGVFVIK